MAAWSDVRGMVIPNNYSLIIIAAFAVAAGAVYFLAKGVFFDDLMGNLITGAAVFVVTFALFSFKIIGGGDAKLFTAFSFWCGSAALASFTIYTALIGALLGLVSLAILRFKPFKNPVPGGWVARLQEGDRAVPYGVAITVGAILAFRDLGYLDLVRLSGLLG